MAIGSTIAPAKLAVFKNLYLEMLADYQQVPEEAALLVNGRAEENGVVELAAMTVVANAIMNLDAFLVK